MNYKNLLFILLLATAIGCNSPEEDKDTKNNIENTAAINLDNDAPPTKLSQEDALKGLKGDDKDAAEWLYKNYKGRINQSLVTQALSEMGDLAMNFEYGEVDDQKIDHSIDAYCKKYEGKIDLSHFKAKHSCMHGFMGADETNPYFTEFKFMGKTKEGTFAFYCTFTAENSEVKEMKDIEVIKDDKGFAISMIRCRKSI